jgi:hypothetical protein
VVSRNANIDVRLFFAAVPGKSKVSHNVRAQALKIKIRFHGFLNSSLVRGATVANLYGFEDVSTRLNSSGILLAADSTGWL